MAFIKFPKGVGVSFFLALQNYISVVRAPPIVIKCCKEGRHRSVNNWGFKMSKLQKTLIQ